jgi:hypothetical protein
MDLSHDEALLLAFQAELDAIPREKAPRTEEEER